MATVSIGLPVYNGERYLADALDGVLRQTASDWSLIICDNCSSDRTAEIARRYSERDARIKYIRHGNNIGAKENFNQAYILSPPARYHVTLAADDYWEPSFLAEVIARLDADPGITLGFSHVRVINETTGREFVERDPLRAFGKAPPVNRLKRALLPFWGTLIYAVIRRASLPKEYFLHEDPGMWPELHQMTRLALQGPFEIVDMPLFVRRLHNANLHCFPRRPLRLLRAIRILNQGLLRPLSARERVSIAGVWYWRHSQMSVGRVFRQLSKLNE